MPHHRRNYKKALDEDKSIFCENEALSYFIKLTIPDFVCSYDVNDFKIYDILIFSYGYTLWRNTKEYSKNIGLI